MDEVQEDEFLNGPARYVAIFMNVFDVHVNRAPVAGTVTETAPPGRVSTRRVLARGRLHPATNSRPWSWKTRRGGGSWWSRSPGCWPGASSRIVKPGQTSARGERLGLICFGSRVDLYLPGEAEILVKIGDRVKAGSSIVARWP